MQRLKSLERYPKIILLLLAAMVLVFTCLYAFITSQEGYLYMDTILIASEESGNTLYSGKIEGTQAVFTVSADHAVTFQYGETVYGPYTVKEDPTAIPKDSADTLMKGIELSCGTEIIFRGGVWENYGLWWLTNEDGSPADAGVITIVSDGIMTDENGNIIDPMEPTISTILDLMAGPALSHKGDWILCLLGVFICFVTSIHILFADELFRFSMAFKVYDPSRIEPSDWELAARRVAWTVLPVFALSVFIFGLQ